MGEASPQSPPTLHMEDDSSESEQLLHETFPQSDTGSHRFYEQVQKCIADMAVHLKPLIENGSDDESSVSSIGENTPLNKTDNEKSSNDLSTGYPLAVTNKLSASGKNGYESITQATKNMKHLLLIKSADETKCVKGSKRNLKSSVCVEARGVNHMMSSPSCESSQQKCLLSRPMQRKLFSLLQCDMLEEEGRSRSARIARSLGERVVSELLVLQQFPHQLSSNLWAAVRTRGCQFLGPAMQEEVLKLILLALEDGSPLSRKVLVLFVVQKLEVRYPQASKTAIGHVVQLLYRASCFKVQKRDGESSLMQLKDEFRQYEALRREHDSQIVQIALEAGLRISPEQWSSLLYGDVAHKPHMQSIIDKHQSPQSFSQNITEVVAMLQNNPETTGLLRLKPHLEFLSNIDPSPDCPAPSWENLEAVMRSLNTVIAAFVDHLTIHAGEHGSGPASGSSSQHDPLTQNTRYKTSLCRDFSAKGICPRGPTCTFAHTQEELEKYRLRSRKNGVRGRLPTQEKTTSSLTQSESDQLRQVQLLTKLKGNISAETSTQTVGEGGVDPPKFPSSPAETPSLMKNSGPAEMKLIADSQSFPCGVGGVKFSPVEVDRRPHLNMPTTRLTFSRPALDGQEPSNVVAMNQQVSLHPNNLRAGTFLPPQSMSIGSSPGLRGPVAPAQGLLNSVHAPSTTSRGSIYHQHQHTEYHHHHQHQQQYLPNNGTLTSTATMPANLPLVPTVDGGIPVAGDYGRYQDLVSLESNQSQLTGMTDQYLQQQQQYQQQSGVMHAAPMVSYPLQPQKEGATLKDLWLRKQDIIQHLRDDPTFLSWQDPTLYRADSHRAGFHGLDTVLSFNKNTREAMPKPVSDMFVATRSTQSLDKLVAEDPSPMPPRLMGDEERDMNNPVMTTVQQLLSMQQQQQQNHQASHTSFMPPPPASSLLINGACSSGWSELPFPWQSVSNSSSSSSCGGAGGMAHIDSASSVTNSYYSNCSSSSSIADQCHMSYKTSAATPRTNDVGFPISSAMFSTYSPTSSHQGQQRIYDSLSSSGSVVSINNSAAVDTEFSSFPGDDGDESTIPFEQTKVSKFGPISRLNKTRCDSSAPVQVTADLSRHTLPTATVTGYGLEPALSSTQPGPHLFHGAATSQSKVAQGLIGEPAVKPTALESRSIWQQSPIPSHKNIAQLMAGAAGAVSNNEKLAYQLQAVELEISMKTGRQPEPVSKMIQAAVGPSQLSTSGAVDGKGMMDIMASGHVTARLRNMELGSSPRADERFADWHGVSK